MPEEYLRKLNYRCFFFSSRRRHTRCLSDWSSDVCSSDLPVKRIAPTGARIDAGGDKLALGVVDVGPAGEFGDHERVRGAVADVGDAHLGGKRGGPDLLRHRSEERRVGKEGRGRGWWGCVR